MVEADTDQTSVVVVEDEEPLAHLYKDALTDEFSVQTATTGTQALEIIDKTDDVVLLDRNLPDLPGDEVLAELRSRGNNVPVAMVTAVDPGSDIVDMPFDEYLLKPVDSDELVHTVHILANRGKFEEKSREFFRLASKISSLNTQPGETSDQDSHRRLLTQMTSLQSELNSTIQNLLEDTPTSQTRPNPSQAEIESLLTDVAEHNLPDEVRQLVEEYQSLQDARPPFMWKWVHQLAPKNTLPCVKQNYRNTSPVNKTLTILFITLLDDILEKRRDQETFNEIAKIPFGHHASNDTTPNIDSDYVAFAHRVWGTLENRLEQAPNFDVYADLFYYDLKQAINAIEYSDLAIRRPDLTTMEDLERYESHNMVMYAYADMDLMYSPLAVMNDISTIRKAVGVAQLMARIGNWVSTWEREIHEGDYSSGPIIYALENELISRSELANTDELNDEMIERFVDQIKSNGVEKKFLTQWEQYYHQLWNYNNGLSNIDLSPYIRGTEEVLRYHIASTGLK